MLLQVVAFASAAVDQQVMEASTEDSTSTNLQPATETNVVQGAQHVWAPYQSGKHLFLVRAIPDQRLSDTA